MKKKVTDLLKYVIAIVIVFIEEYLFYVIFLSGMMTKSRRDMWLTFVVGSLCISLLNAAAVHFISKCTKGRFADVALLPVASVFVSLFLIVLSCVYDKPLLAKVDYRNEINYFTILIFSFFIDVWAALLALIEKIISKLKSS